jgi:O-acetyl-ADP-ribose deacetylase (regulator of RNase III)
MLSSVILKLKSVPEMNNIRLRTGDITKLDIQAIVNAANNSLLGGGGVDGAIHRAAGPELLEECRELHGCATGEAKITRAYQLKAKYVIHTVGPVYNGGHSNEAELLRKAYFNSLKIAKEHQIKSIAFPNISSGIYGYPKEEAALIAIKTVKEFTDSHKFPEEVIFVCFDKENFKIYHSLLDMK